MSFNYKLETGKGSTGGTQKDNNNTEEQKMKNIKGNVFILPFENIKNLNITYYQVKIDNEKNQREDQEVPEINKTDVGQEKEQEEKKN